MSSDRKKQHFKDYLVAIGIGTLMTGANSSGIYSYLKTRQPTHPHSEYASGNPKRVKVKSLDEEFRCPICFEAMTSNVSTFSCQHRFHKKCIGQWQAISRTCPVCRTPFGEL